MPMADDDPAESPSDQSHQADIEPRPGADSGADTTHDADSEAGAGPGTRDAADDEAQAHQLVGDAADAARRARGALVATIAERAAESTWLDRQLDRVARLLARYEEWSESPEQTQVDVWAAQFSGWFRAGDRPDRFAGLRRAVNQARLDESWDLYLGRSATLAAVAAVVGAVLGLGLSVLFTVTGVFASLSTSVAAPTGLARVLSQLRVPILSTLLTLLVSGVFGGLTFAMFYLLPFFQRNQREKQLDQILPYGVTYMYALSRGDLPLVKLIRHLSRAGDAYGVLAEEFELIEHQLDYFGRDVRRALRETRVHTPSETFADLLDDLGTVLDTGGELTPFLGDATDEMREEARRSQETYLETLEIFSELYIVAGVVTPLLLVTILVSLGAIQAGIFTLLIPVIYGYIPLVSVGSWFALQAMRADEPEATAEALTTDTTATTVADIDATIDALNAAAPATTSPNGAGGDADEPAAVSDGGGGGDGAPTAATTGGASAHYGHDDVGRSRAADRELLAELAHAKRREQVTSWLRAPFTKPRHRPLLALGWSLPLALLVMGVLLATGTATLAGLTQRPVWATTLLGVLPFVIAATPVTVYDELYRRRQQRINQELPTILRQLGSANQAGLTLTESFGVVGETASGLLAREFRRLATALHWNVDLETALAELSSRLRNPRFTRAALLLIEGSTAARDLGPVLDALEADARNAAELDRDRRQDTLVYQFLAIVGFLVFLGVIGVL
ncbi:MAG: type II secretion system F family protein, partial [Salinirussus sp.]